MQHPSAKPKANEAETIFNAALSFLHAERAAYVAGACGDRIELRQRVEALLCAHEEAAEFLPEAPRGAMLPEGAGAPDLSPTAMLDPLSEKPGDKIGHYKLLQKIGEGGCGLVYVAEQEQPVRRRVALKVVKLGMDTKQVIARFEAERQALALMDHPNIAKVFDAGATETGRPYFVMELVRGIKITDYCDQNNLSTRERLELFVKVCQAIQHAHQKGVIHRDIKPSNILVTLHDGVPVPKVIDFGIAKATTDQRLTDKTLYTAFEQFIGTPAYMSPEQAEMSGLDIDTRSDIYSLGVLLYELLTGKTPFDAKTLLAAGLDEMRRTIREQEPLRPSTRLSTMVEGELTTTARLRRAEAPRLVNLIRGDLDWIVMKALEKDRTRRYETVNGLARDIQRHLGQEPVVACPPSTTYRVQKFVHRNKVMVAAAAAIMGVLVVGIVVATWLAVLATRAKREQGRLRRQAEAQELAARRQGYASDMNLAQQALALNNLGRAQELLSRHRPGGKSEIRNPKSEIDLRGWEWRYLWHDCQSDALSTFCQRSNRLVALAVSHDGKWLATGEEGALSVWELRTHREMRLPAGDGWSRLAFSPREALLAFSIDPGKNPSNRQFKVRLWDVESEQIVAELPLGAFCQGLAFSDDGQTLVTSTGHPDDKLELWRVRGGQKLTNYSARQVEWGIGSPFAATRDLGLAAHGMVTNQLRVVDLRTGKERWSAERPGGNITAVAFSADGKVLASSAGIDAPSIRLWDALSGQELGRPLQGHGASVGALVFWPDGKTLASSSGDQTIRLWDLTDKTNVRPLRTLRGHKLEVWPLVLLPDNSTLASGCKDGSVLVWDTTRRRQPANLTLPVAVSHWRFAPDSQSVLTVDRQGHVARWRGATFQEMEPLVEMGTNCVGPRISDDGRWVAAGFTNGIIQVWDLQRRTRLTELAVHTGRVFVWKFLEQGKSLVIIHEDDNSMHEWDLGAGQERQSWHGVGAFWDWLADAHAFSFDERWCLTLARGGEFLLRDMATGREIRSNLHVRWPIDAAFSPDGKLFALASNQDFARLYDAATLQEVAGLSASLQSAISVAFSPDGQRLAVGSSGKEAIKLWDVESHQELLSLEGQSAIFKYTAFSPDGNILGSLNWEGLLHLWRAPSWAEIEPEPK